MKGTREERTLSRFLSHQLKLFLATPTIVAGVENYARLFAGPLRVQAIAEVLQRVEQLRVVP